MYAPLTTVIQQAPDPWWSMLLQVLAPLVAVAIALGGVLRDNRLRRAEHAAAEQREAERALGRARGLIITAQGRNLAGAGGETWERTFTLENQTGAPVFDVDVLPERPERAPNATWIPEYPPAGSYPVIPQGGDGTFRGAWRFPAGERPLDEPGEQTRATVWWRDVDWRPFLRSPDGNVTEQAR